MARESVQVPDDVDFTSFREECCSDKGWCLKYKHSGITVWVQMTEEEKALHKIKCRMQCKELSAETLYDVLHDAEYRRKWDDNMVETFDIGRLTANADVGYYAWRCPTPLKNRDVVTLRSWIPMGTDYIIMNYSVKHPNYPPKKERVRAVSIQTGYLVETNTANSCTLTYLAEVDPKDNHKTENEKNGILIINHQAMKKIYKACLKYREWKEKHNPSFKPWVHPEQSNLPTIALSDLSIQHADSLENIDESGILQAKDEKAVSSDEDSLN